MRELEPDTIDGAKAAVGITTRVGTEGCFRVDLPLFAGDLNERLLQTRRAPYSTSGACADGAGAAKTPCELLARG